MDEIYVVRHGQDEDNAEGILNGQRDRPLTGLGREQARVVAEKLKNKDISVIYSSPLLRAAETAQTIARRLELPKVRSEPLLIERDFGILTGRPIRQIQTLSSRVLETDGVTYFLDAEGAEEFPLLLARAQKVLRKMQDQHHEESVLLVTHGDIGKMLRAAFHGWNWEKGLRQPYFGNTAVLELRRSGDTLRW